MMPELPEQHLPLTVPPPPVAIATEVEEIMQLPSDEMEAAFSLLLDRLWELHTSDPLQGFRETIHLSMALTIEQLKLYAPIITQAAQERADAYANTGRLQPISRDEEKLARIVARLGENLERLAVSNVKIYNELQRQSLSKEDNPVPG